MWGSGLGKVYRSRKQWQEIMERYRSSGLTQAEFCEREGISLTSFHKWQAKLQVAVKRSFVELPMPASGDTWRLELEFTDGLKLKLR